MVLHAYEVVLCVVLHDYYQVGVCCMLGAYGVVCCLV